ncbi:hypothetical protein [Spiroplasma endosymbiont of Dioctria linearis]|uniref:hypothetical protein n=1 Tax=Spiroplasma endosymbiont of Dioctria linearis TaxID=3066290 RepID=UPI00313DC30A
MVNNLLSLQASNLLILSIVLLTVAPLSSIYSWYLTGLFKTNKSEVKFANKLLVGIMIGLQIVSIVAAVMSLVFYFIDLKSLTMSLFIVCIVISFVTSAIWFSMVLFFSNQLWFYIDDEKIVTLGESIKLSKIQKIIEDDEKSAVYVNYLEGRRTIKKIKFSKKTALGIYFLENASKTGVNPEKGDEVTYFKEQVAKIRAEALEISKKDVKAPIEKVELETEKTIEKAEKVAEKTVAKAQSTAKKTVAKAEKTAEKTVEKAEKTAEKTVAKAESTAKKTVAKSKKDLEK